MDFSPQGDLCACLLNEEAHRFSIKCDAEDMSHVHEAWSILANEPACASELGCLAESNNSTCRKNFFIVQVWIMTNSMINFDYVQYFIILYQLAFIFLILI